MMLIHVNNLFEMCNCVKINDNCVYVRMYLKLGLWDRAKAVKLVIFAVQVRRNRFLRTCTAKITNLTAFALSHNPNFRYIRTYTQLSLIFTQLHISNKLLTCINIIYHKYQQNHVNSYKIIKT